MQGFLSRVHFPVSDKTADLILRVRWLVPVAGIVSTIALEMVEGHPFNDPDLAVEILCGGLVMPLLAWALLTELGQAVKRRDKSDFYFGLHRSLAQQLAQRQKWEELVNYVVQFPATLLPVTSTQLYTYDHNKACLEFATKWEVSPGLDRLVQTTPSLCDACPIKNQPRLARVARCQHSHDQHCLPLVYDNILVGALIMYSQGKQSFSVDQSDFLAAVSPEIALALALLIAFPRQMAQARAAGESNERQRITYDLHDNLAQQISYLHLTLDRLMADDTVATLPHLQTDLDHMRGVAADVSERIRNTLSILRSQTIENLPNMITEYAQEVAQRAQFHIEVVSEGASTAVPQLWGQDVFGLIREGIHNVEKHGQATRVRIELMWSAESLTVEVEDNGIGFDPNSTPTMGHYGLLMMSERVAQLQGEFQVNSAAGRGTQLRLRIPIPAQPSLPAKPLQFQETFDDSN